MARGVLLKTKKYDVSSKKKKESEESIFHKKEGKIDRE
jgi:hypothetical protein